MKEVRFYLANLKIPIYGNFKKFMYYDVLQTLAHLACESDYFESMGPNELIPELDLDEFDNVIAK